MLEIKIRHSRIHEKYFSAIFSRLNNTKKSAHPAWVKHLKTK